MTTRDDGLDPLPFACASARRQVHERLDGTLRDAASLDAHVAVCASCREAAEDLAALVGGLGELPGMTLPDADVECVWARTVAAPAHDVRHRNLRWRVAVAAAAVLVGAAMLVPLLRDDVLGRRGAATMSDAEIARAAAEVQLVFKITDRAIQRSNRTAVDRAIGTGVAPALRRIPLLDEGFTGTTNRRN